MTTETRATRYFVTYRNQGRPERTVTQTLQEAKSSADFLKFQGATSVRVRKETQ